MLSVQEGSRKSSVAWLKTVLTSGTAADKTAALVLMVQEAPVHCLSSLNSLLASVKKTGGRRELLQTLGQFNSSLTYLDLVTSEMAVVVSWSLLPFYALSVSTTTVLQSFFRDHPGEPVPDENFWTLRCKGRLTEADTLTIWLGTTPSGLSSAHLHHPPSTVSTGIIIILILVPMTTFMVLSSW